jgi:hypothetical protein
MVTPSGSSGFIQHCEQQIKDNVIVDGTVDVSYDLLIIAPSVFKHALQPLVVHKNTHGLSTILVTLDTIYTEMSQGRDDAEKIKYYIKYALETWNISYVLLVGGMKHQGLFSWYLPVRYVDMNDDWEPRYISDLYYADIYDVTGNFSSWDSDGDGRFSEWSIGQRAEDTAIDLYPDVAVGRLPCRNVGEVRTMVQKIITYETTTYDEAWFNDMLCIAGDTYPEKDNPLWVGYEGEEYAERAIENMTGFNPIRLYTSDGSFTGSEDVIRYLSRGCGFVYFVGHGSPKAWGNHPPDDDTFINGLTVYNIHDLTNGDMLPICVVSGCHNCQFDVSLWRLINRRSRMVGEAITECWGWRITNELQGGSIATIGCTALGYTKEDKSSFSGGLNGLEIPFFTAYAHENKTHVGDAWMSAIQSYLTTYTPIMWDTTAVSDSWIDVKVVQSWVLIGDPSLQIGGFP